MIQDLNFTIILRVCSVENGKKKPMGLTKMQILENSMRSLGEAVKGRPIDIIVILDNTDKGVRCLIDKYIGKHIVEIHASDKQIGNVGTFHKQLELATKQEGFVFLLEDDYMLAPNVFDEMNAFIDLYETLYSDLDRVFITPYYHPDYDNLDVHKEFAAKRSHSPFSVAWEEKLSTTLTFGGMAEAFRKFGKVMVEYGIADFQMWSDLNHNHDISLYVSRPTLAVHMEEEYMIDGLDWCKIKDGKNKD